MAKKARVVWVGADARHELFQCMKCGKRLSVEKNGKRVEKPKCDCRR
jgi:hypothetical protein